jgi:hypothetical protein
MRLSRLRKPGFLLVNRRESWMPNLDILLATCGFHKCPSRCLSFFSFLLSYVLPSPLSQLLQSIQKPCKSFNGQARLRISPRIPPLNSFPRSEDHECLTCLKGSRSFSAWNIRGASMTMPDRLGSQRDSIEKSSALGNPSHPLRSATNNDMQYSMQKLSLTSREPRICSHASVSSPQRACNPVQLRVVLLIPPNTKLKWG